MSGVFWQNLENRAGLINLLQHSMSVPISATGLQGEQPLVHGTNVGKGSRQNIRNFGRRIGSWDWILQSDKALVLWGFN